MYKKKTCSQLIIFISFQNPLLLNTKIKKQPQNLEYFNSLSSQMTNYARCTREIKSNTAMAKAAPHKKNTFHQHIRFKFKEETSTTFGT
jgi:hypothetical protein